MALGLRRESERSTARLRSASAPPFRIQTPPRSASACHPRISCSISRSLFTPTNAVAGLARLGGDEFVVMLRNIQGPDDATTVANRIINALQQPMRLSTHEILVTPSVGVAVYPSDATDVDTLLRNADLAMYFAKRQGPGRFALYKETMNASALMRLPLETQLRSALSPNEFY